MEIITRKDAIANKQDFFFTGIPCKNGHLSEKRVDNYTCIQCAIENRKASYYRDITKSRAKARERKILAYKENPDHFKQLEKTRRTRNSESYREYQNEQYRKHAEKRKRRVREYQKENAISIKTKNAKRYASLSAEEKIELSEKRRAKMVADPSYKKLMYIKAKEWRDKNPDKVRAQHIRERLSRPEVISDDIKRVIGFDKGICFYCSEDCSEKYHIDHIMQFAKKC